MERTVTVTFKIDPTEYHEADDNPAGCIELAIAFIRGEADWPGVATIACDGVVQEIEGEL